MATTRFSIKFTSNWILVRYYPSWLPGGGFQRWAANARVFAEYVRYKPWEAVLTDTV